MAFTLARNGDRLEVRIGGPLDIKSSPEVDAALAEQLDGITYLAIDLADVSYVSSMGLRLLLALQKRMLKQGEMHVVNVQDSVLELFEQTGFSDILTLG